MWQRGRRMIQLTQEQVHAMGKPESSPARVVVINPQTRETFVLVPVAEYDRLVEIEAQDNGSWTDEERDLLRWEACQMLDSFGKAT